ncbi:MAG: amino acid-binding protein [Clostridia bacterium]|nr:amino acid-binding protein [Clostridia bacterium]
MLDMDKILTELTGEEDITLITLHNIPADMKLMCDIFDSFSRERVVLDMISQTAPTGGHISISFTLKDDDLPRAIKIMSTFKSKLPSLRSDVNPGNAKIVFFGERMKDNYGVAAYVMRLFSDNHIMLKLITTSDNDISCLLSKDDFEYIYDVAAKALKIS